MVETFPANESKARMIPILKSGTPEQVGNYNINNNTVNNILQFLFDWTTVQK